MEFTERQRKTLRGLGHPLKPVVMIADRGLSDNVAHEIEQALAFHELIKISIRAERDARDAIIAAIGERFAATLVQRTGNIALFFRRNQERPKVVLGSR